MRPGSRKEAYCDASLAAGDVVRQSEVARGDVGAGQGRARHRRHCVGPLHIVVCQRTYCTLQHHMSMAVLTVWPAHNSHLCCCTQQFQCKLQQHGSAATVAVGPGHDSWLSHCTECCHCRVQQHAYTATVWPQNNSHLHCCSLHQACTLPGMLQQQVSVPVARPKDCPADIVYPYRTWQGRSVDRTFSRSSNARSHLSCCTKCLSKLSKVRSPMV